MNTLWTKIEEHVGQPFRQSRGKEFTYVIRGNTLKPSTTNWNIPRKDFETAAGISQIKSVSQLQKFGLQGPSYVYAIVTDPRIRPCQRMISLETSVCSEENDPGADSSEQRKAEKYIIAIVGERFQTPLKSETVRMKSGCSVQIDGAAVDHSTLCEAWAHQGKPRVHRSTR
jgi:hypothetical protein